MQSIYIHIPFCQKKCKYCSFFSQSGTPAFVSDYVAALIREIDSIKAVYDSPIKTIYFGGGTPSLLNVPQWEAILAAINSSFKLDNPEISIEVNPGTVDSAKIAAIVGVGFNRVSIGIQSLHDSELFMLGRVHSAESAIRTIEEFYKQGIRNISVDLMYGLPGQTAADFLYSIQGVMALPITHLSAYCLHLEQDTVLEQEILCSMLPPLDEDTEIVQHELLVSATKKYGFEHYEISNFAREGFYSRHNQAYWRYQDYLGLGAGATSMIDFVRYTNTRDLHAYIQNPGGSFAEKELISLDSRIAEAMFMGMRQLAGVDLFSLSNRFGKNLLNHFQQQLKGLLALQLVEYHDPYLRLSEKGILLSNEVFEQFLP